MASLLRAGVVLALAGAAALPSAAAARPAWLHGDRIPVSGDTPNQNCRTGVCRHAGACAPRSAGRSGPTGASRVYRSSGGVRLDGPVAFHWHGRLFMIARKHLEGEGVRKRTAYEITGDLEGGPLRITELGVLPSAGDTSNAGVARI